MEYTLAALLGFTSCGVMVIAFGVVYLALRERTLYRSAINLPRYVYHTIRCDRTKAVEVIQATEAGGVWTYFYSSASVEQIVELTFRGRIG